LISAVVSAAAPLPLAALPVPCDPYRDLIISAHQVGVPLVWWDNLNVRLPQELAGFAADKRTGCVSSRCPPTLPSMNPAEGVWSLLKRAIANFYAADLEALVRIIKRKLKKVQYRPYLITGCLTGTGLTIEPVQ
jgi:hypothetical protein